MRRKDMTHENSAAKSIQKPTQVRIAILLLYVYTVISILVYSALSIINGKFSIGSFIYQAIISLVSIFFIFMIISFNCYYPHDQYLRQNRLT